jgi:FMN reductase
MAILIIFGSPSLRPSRSSALLEHAAGRLRTAGLAVERILLSSVPPADLVLVRNDSDAALAFRDAVARSDAILIATPVYNASIPGGLKALLDLLPEKALADKLVLPLASGGSAGHQLAIEYSLKPVLSALGARHVLAGVFAADADVEWSSGTDGAASMRPELVLRLDAAVDALLGLLESRSAANVDRSMRNALKPLFAASVASGLPLETAEAPQSSAERCSA